MNQTFEEYVKHYNKKDPDIEYKYNHSYRVMEKTKLLTKNLTEEDQMLAEVIGLYHDIGRFEQDKLYNTFDDSKVFDHADYGVKILFEDNLIKQIPVSEKYYKIINKAIKNHNKYEIEKGLTGKELLHAKLIRDADKLDILYSASEKLMTKKAIDLEGKTFSVRDSINKEFYNKKQIKTSAILGSKTNSEKIISFIALVFDLNFKESAKFLLDNNILENLYNNITNKEAYKKYFTFAINYLKEMIKC